MCLIVESGPSNRVEPSVLKKFPIKEVKMHNSVGDAWLVNSGKVYDVSGWKEHPGGRVIFSHAGEDCTDIFTAFHPASARDVMPRFLIGELDQSSAEYINNRRKKLHKAYREVRGQLVEAGLFNGSKLYFLWKFVSNIATALAGWALIAWPEGGVLAHLLGGFFMAIFWQQGGWLGHDFGHNQVFKNRAYNDIAGIFTGNFLVGLARSWWDDKHHYHHAVPNTTAVPERANVIARKGDPDIDTMPLIAWTQDQAKSAVGNPFHTWMVKHQTYLYVPFLMLGRLSWVMQSFTYVFRYDVMWGSIRYNNSYKPGSWESRMIFWEKVGLLFHYLWTFVLFKPLGPVEGPLIFVYAQALSGIFLAIVFALGHNGMTQFPSEEDYPDFWTLQVTTTRNVFSTYFADWFCGGLQHQVEHHLFPTLPRHNLGEANRIVKRMCKEHGVSYHETTMWEGTKEVFSFLKQMSVEFMDSDHIM